METDYFYTIASPSEGIYRKSSKFLAFAFQVSSEEQVKQHLNDLKRNIMMHDIMFCIYYWHKARNF